MAADASDFTVPNGWLSRTTIRERRKLQTFVRLGERDGAVCNHCGGIKDLTIDHVAPDGGNGDDNLQLLCRGCNSSKRDRPDDKTVRWSSAAWQAGFTMIPNAVLLDPTLSAYAHRVYSLLLHYARQDEECWPGQGGLAKNSGCGERSVRAAIRELEDSGLLRTKRRGQGQTNVYILLAPRETPYAEDDSRTASRAGQDSRPAYGAGQERRLAPVPIEEDAVEEETTTSTARGTAAIDRVPKIIEPIHDLPVTVDRKPVSPVEASLAIAVLAEWNQQTSQRLTSRDWRSKIVMRIREYPSLTLDDHAHVIAASLAAPWWKGPATPSVVYGSGAQFERSILTAKAGPQDDRRRTGPGGGPTPEEMRRRAERLAEEGL